YPVGHRHNLVKPRPLRKPVRFLRLTVRNLRALQACPISGGTEGAKREDPTRAMRDWNEADFEPTKGVHKRGAPLKRVRSGKGDADTFPRIEMPPQHDERPRPRVDKQARRPRERGGRSGSNHHQECSDTGQRAHPKSIGPRGGGYQGLSSLSGLSLSVTQVVTRR